MKKYTTFELEELESYGKYFRFRLFDKDYKCNNEWHYLPKEYFPENLLASYNVSKDEENSFEIPTQLILITDEEFSITDNPFGQEAEDLRLRFEKLAESINEETNPLEIADKINYILEDVDARDSLFFLENKK